MVVQGPEHVEACLQSLRHPGYGSRYRSAGAGTLGQSHVERGLVLRGDVGNALWLAWPPTTLRCTSSRPRLRAVPRRSSSTRLPSCASHSPGCAARAPGSLRPAPLTCPGRGGSQRATWRQPRDKRTHGIAGVERADDEVARHAVVCGPVRCLIADAELPESIKPRGAGPHRPQCSILTTETRFQVCRQVRDHVLQPDSARDHCTWHGDCCGYFPCPYEGSFEIPYGPLREPGRAEPPVISLLGNVRRARRHGLPAPIRAVPTH